MAIVALKEHIYGFFLVFSGPLEWGSCDDIVCVGVFHVGVVLFVQYQNGSFLIKKISTQVVVDLKGK